MNDQKYFEHEYTVADDLNAAARVLCMRCGLEIMGPTYVEMDKKNHPGTKIRAYVVAPNSTYRAVPILTEVDDHPQMSHLPMCQDCDRDFVLTPENALLIRKQLITSTIKNLRWMGYPKESELSEENRYNSMTFIKRMRGQELVDFYRKKPKED